MDEFTFPDIKAHYATINGYNLIFGPGFSSVLHTSQVGFDFAKNCSGLTISESREWLRERNGDISVRTADNLMWMVNSGFFTEPKLDTEKLDTELPTVASYGIGITHKCNMQCRYCFAAGLRGPDLPEDISLNTVHAAIDLLFDELKPPWVTISLGITGEPQIKWDIVSDLIDYAHSRSEDSFIGVDFHITTNGLQAHSEMLDYLRTHDDMNVTLSWDGPPEIHNRQRLSPDCTDTYDKVSNTFDILRSTMQSRPSVVATVSALAPDIAGVFTHLFDRGVRDLIIKPLRSNDPALAVNEESLPAFKSGYAELAELLLTPDDAQVERLFTIMKEDDYLGRFILRLTQGRRMNFRCMAARTHLEVDTSGDIYPCPSLVGITGFQVGNVSSGLNECALESFRNDTFCTNLQACKHCWAKYYCGGPCTYMSVITSKRPDMPHKPSCELTMHLIELAGYIISKLDRERPGLLSHVIALRSLVPMGYRPEACCRRAHQSDLWGFPAEAWKVPDPIVLTSKEHAGGYLPRRGQSESNATIHLQWDDDFLYLMAEVHENSFVPPKMPEGEWWFRDSIQFAFDPGNDGGENKYPWKLPEGDYEYGIAWVDGETHVYDCQVDPLRPSKSGNAIVTRQDDITTYRVAIPWKQMSEFTPSVGAECRFSVVVNDCDGGARGWLQWTNGLATRKAPARFGLIRLTE